MSTYPTLVDGIQYFVEPGTSSTAIRSVGALKYKTGQGLATTSKSASYSLTTDDEVILVTSGSGAAVTMTLPTAVGYTGLHFHIQKVDSGTTACGIATTSAQTITDGFGAATTKSLALQGDYIDVVSDGTNWQGWGT